MRYYRTTGLMRDQMQELVWRVRGALKAPWKMRTGRPKSYGLYKAVQIACIYLRQNVTEESIGDMNDISQPTVSRIVTVIVPVVRSVLEEFVPGAREAIEVVKGRVVLVDGTLTPTNVDSPPLHALRNTNGTVNGVYSSSGSSTFPTNSANAANYWVDVVFSQSAVSTAPAVTTVTPGNGATGVAVSVAPTATFSEAVQPGTVSFTVKDSGGNTVAGTVSFNNADTVATFTPGSSLDGNTTYTAVVSGAQNASGTPMSSPFSWSFSTGAVSQCPCSIWQDGTPTGAVDAADTSPVTLGVRFQASSDGTITGIRFYKESDNTGSHTGSLWTVGGTLLATGTFSGESGSGWQELDFSSPVPVTSGTTYVASYHTDAGHYAITPNGAGVGGDQRAADRAGQRRGVRLRLGGVLPRPVPTTLRTTGSTWCTRLHRHRAHHSVCKSTFWRDL